MWGPSSGEPEKKPLSSSWERLRGRGPGERARAAQPAAGRGLWRGHSRPLCSPPHPFAHTPWAQLLRTLHRAMLATTNLTWL